jgi:hypothetical protein
VTAPELLPDSDAPLQKKGPDLVGDSRALTHQPRANAMRRLQVELVNGPGWHKPHGRPLHGFGNRLGIAEVIHLALAEGEHELGGDQLHVMPEGQQLTAEMMGTYTGFRPIKQGGMLARRASIWPRDSF